MEIGSIISTYCNEGYAFYSIKSEENLENADLIQWDDDALIEIIAIAKASSNFVEIDFYKEFLDLINVKIKMLKASIVLEKPQTMKVILEGPHGSGKSTLLKYEFGIF